MTQPSRPGFPRPILLGAGALVAFTICAAAYGRLTGSGVEPPTAPITAQRILQFADRDDGAVVVTLANTGRTLDVMTGQNGFLRGTLRGFGRIRRLDGIGSLPPLRLTGYADGRLVLFDPETNRVVELEAFGSANEAVFVRLLTMQPRSETANVPRSETANVPTSETANAPRSETANAPRSETANVPTSETANVPRSETANVPTSETANAPTSRSASATRGAS